MLVHRLPELWMLDNKIFKIGFFQSCVLMSYLKALGEDMWDKMETVQVLPVTKRDSKAKERSLILILHLFGYKDLNHKTG